MTEKNVIVESKFTTICLTQNDLDVCYYNETPEKGLPTPRYQGRVGICINVQEGSPQNADYADCRLQTADCRLQTVQTMQTAQTMQTEYSGTSI